MRENITVQRIIWMVAGLIIMIEIFGVHSSRKLRKK